MNNHKKVLALVGLAGAIGLTLHKAITKEMLEETATPSNVKEDMENKDLGVEWAEQLSKLLHSFVDKKSAEDVGEPPSEDEIARYKEMAEKLKAEAESVDAFTEKVEEAFADVVDALEDAAKKIEDYIKQELQEDNGE